MLLLNIEYVPGKEIEALGLVKGTVVQSKNFGKDFMAGMKTLVGGEITGYTEMLIEARRVAFTMFSSEGPALNYLWEEGGQTSLGASQAEQAQTLAAYFAKGPAELSARSMQKVRAILPDVPEGLGDLAAIPVEDADGAVLGILSASGLSRRAGCAAMLKSVGFSFARLCGNARTYQEIPRSAVNNIDRRLASIGRIGQLPPQAAQLDDAVQHGRNTIRSPDRDKMAHYIALSIPIQFSVRDMCPLCRLLLKGELSGRVYLCTVRRDHQIAGEEQLQTGKECPRALIEAQKSRRLIRGLSHHLRNQTQHLPV